jgi:hypothetical protein
MACSSHLVCIAALGALAVYTVTESVCYGKIKLKTKKMLALVGRQATQVGYLLPLLQEDKV